MNSFFDSGGAVLLAGTSMVLPLAGDRVCAGFPSPAEDFDVKGLDLVKELITHPQATFLLRVKGESMLGAGIADGDMLVVNKSVKPRHGQIVVAEVDGQFTVKFLHMRHDRIQLRAANPNFPDITPQEGQTLEVWGVVSACIKRFAM